MLIVQSFPIVTREAWLDLRRPDVTASEIGALYGQHKHLTRLQLAYNKLYGEPDKTRDRGVLRRGHILEPACAAAIEHDHKIRVHKTRYYLRGWDPENPFIRTGASLDYEHEGDGTEFLQALDKAKIPHDLGGMHGLPIRVAVECKSVDRDVFESEWSDGPPAQHIYQALWQASLGGHDCAIIAGLVCNYDHDLHLYVVPRNPELEAKILADITEFIHSLEDGQMPEAEARDNATIAKMTKPVDGAVVDLRGDPAWEFLLEERERCKAKMRAVEYEIDALEVRLKEAMGDHTVALVDGWTVTWKPNSRGVRSLKIDRKKRGK